MKLLELTTLATALDVLGIIFSSNRMIGYSFLGAGIILSVIATIKTKRGRAKRDTLGELCLD